MPVSLCNFLVGKKQNLEQCLRQNTLNWALFILFNLPELVET